MWPRGWGLLTALPSTPEPSGVPPPPRPDSHATGSQKTRVGETWAGTGAHGAHCQVSGSCGVTVGASSWPPCSGRSGFPGKPTAGRNTGRGHSRGDAGKRGWLLREQSRLLCRAVPEGHSCQVTPGHHRTTGAGRGEGPGWRGGPQLLDDSAGPPLVRPVWRGEVCPSLPGLVLMCRGVLSFFLALCRAHLRLPLADVNACATSHVGCEGECRKTMGGFYCSCPPGCQLRGDGKTCQCGPPAPTRPWPQCPCSGCSLGLPPPHPWAALRRVLE